MRLSFPISNKCIVKLLHMYLQCTIKMNIILFVHESSFPFMDDLNSKSKILRELGHGFSRLTLKVCIMYTEKTNITNYNYELWLIIYNLTHPGLPRWVLIQSLHTIMHSCIPNSKWLEIHESKIHHKYIKWISMTL